MKKAIDGMNNHSRYIIDKFKILCNRGYSNKNIRTCPDNEFLMDKFWHIVRKSKYTLFLYISLLKSSYDVISTLFK